MKKQTLGQKLIAAIQAALKDKNSGRIVRLKTDLATIYNKIKRSEKTNKTK